MRAWEARTADDLAGLLAGFDAPWWIAGGWALDLFLGRETRRHDDIDVAVLRRDQRTLYDFLRGWDLRYATPEHMLEPWQGEALWLPVHGIWARRSSEPAAPWTCEFLLNEERGGRWLYRRDERVSRPLDELGAEAEGGIPFLRPGIVLLYKAGERTPKSEADLEAVLPRLDEEERRWLRAALETWAPGHPWLERL